MYVSHILLLCLVLAPPWITAFAQVPDPTDERYELSLKSSVPAFQNIAVRYSPDEHYAAITGDGTVYIYNLHTLAEIRRIHLDKIAFSALGTKNPLAFDPTSQHMFIASGYKLLDCDLETPKQCETLRKDIASDFDVGFERKDRFHHVNHKT